MRRALAVGLALLALAPPASAAPQPEFPDAVKALTAGWIAEAEALGAPHAGKAFHADAATFLASAREAQSAGRVRSVMFDLETYVELVTAGALMEEAEALPSDAERKTFVLQRTSQWHQEARAAWDAYRARLADAEDEVKSLQGMELALYSADQALGARLLTDDRENVAREFPKQPTVDRGYVVALVRSGRTALLDLGWAEDLLGAVSAHEGLPPRLNASAWDDLAATALLPLEGNVPSHLQPFEALAADVRANNETTMAVAISLAEQRASRATSIFVIYGDAAGRRNVTADATGAMGRQLDNASMQPARDAGLLGVFTADAVDRALKTRGYAEEGLLDLGYVIAAWASLDHAKFVTSALSSASPVQPPTPQGEDGKETPLGGPVALAALGAAAVLLAARRRA